MTVNSLPQELRSNVLVSSKENSYSTGPAIKGYEFNDALDTPLSLSALLDSYSTMGFQATNLHTALQICHRMLRRRREIQDVTTATQNTDGDNEGGRFCLFLGYTSNMVSCGNRECIRFLVEHKLVDAIVTTAGGIEEDFIKCLKPTLLLESEGARHPDDDELRKQGCNRIGNLIVPNDNYCVFENWLMPLLDEMLREQQDIKNNVAWTPSKIIRRLGQRINDESSIYYWAAKNNIPVFCPAITDGSLGDMLFFHTYRNSTSLKVDILEDVKALNLLAMRAAETGMLILGGGVVKHHIANANLMRNGAEHAVFINTGNDWDGSDSGAGPDEAVSWGKIKVGANAVKVHADASLIFPLIVGAVFLPEAKRQQEARRRGILDTLYT